MYATIQNSVWSTLFCYFAVNFPEVGLDELQKAQLQAQAKYTTDTFADQVAFLSPETVRRYFRRGEEHYPPHWKELGVRAYKVDGRRWLAEVGTSGDKAMKQLPTTLDAIGKLEQVAGFFEERWPLSEVLATFEKRLPISEVMTQVSRFVEEAPPPHKVLAEIGRTLRR